MDKIKPAGFVLKTGHGMVFTESKPYCLIDKWRAVYDQSAIDALRAEVEAKQARIDALMLEHSPDEMTPEQLAEWAQHQKPAPEGA